MWFSLIASTAHTAEVFAWALVCDGAGAAGWQVLLLCGKG